jgi:predicted ATP-dependent endonuclease of OLD family
VFLKSFAVKNFRRLKDVRVDLASEATIFVGANNSGKTSATHIFRLLLGEGSKFSAFDFSADCWDEFNRFDWDAFNNLTLEETDVPPELPIISIDLWFEVDEDNLHRVIDLLPDLDWQGKLVGVRITFEARDMRSLYDHYRDACQEATRSIDAGGSESDQAGSYKPWPQDLYDYLRKRLSEEYRICYYKLDAAKFDADLKAEAGYVPPNLVDGAKVLCSLIKVDFLDAQRYLSDSEAHGRTEDLSKRLSKFYVRNLDKQDPDLSARRALAEAEGKLNDHFAKVFAPTLESLSKLGYPGITNPELVIRTELNPDSVLSGSAQVHYAVAGAVPDADDRSALMLPDKYNGLGFKNLIYMVVEILDFHHAWRQSEESRPPVHLIIIEEPESHLHAQLQQVFIRQVQGIVGEAIDGVGTQFVITTHSSHIVYEDFRSIRYFSRLKRDDAFQYTEVKNLSTFYDNEEPTTRDFLLQYIRLTHCDLFFADAAILVEGNVERLLLPLIIHRNCKQLEACHLTILEVGGAFAHKFRKLIEFLELTCLIITDLDSVLGPRGNGTEQDELAAETDEDDESEAPRSRTACLTTTPGAVTSNEMLKAWVPELTSVEELLGLDPKLKMRGSGGPFTGSVRVSYQTRQPARWQGESKELAGRTFEDSFAYQNLEWSQDEANKELGLRLGRATREGDLDAVATGIFNKVRNLDKTKFALALMSTSDGWTSPVYIAEGLEWLAEQICPPPSERPGTDILGGTP